MIMFTWNVNDVRTAIKLDSYGNADLWNSCKHGFLNLLFSGASNDVSFTPAAYELLIHELSDEILELEDLGERRC